MQSSWETKKESVSMNNFRATFYFRGCLLAEVKEENGRRYCDITREVEDVNWTSYSMVIFSNWISKAAVFMETGNHLILELDSVELN